MSSMMPALFFLSLPDLKSLCCVTLTLPHDLEEPRTKQLSTCRELILLFLDVLVSPTLDSFTEVTAVMNTQFFQRGFLQSFVQRHCLQMGSPEQVHLGVLQACISFSIVSRLAPDWNKAGLYLIRRDFMSERGKLTAVSMVLSCTDGKLCLSIRPNAVRMPPNMLEDLEMSPLVLKRFRLDVDSVLDLQSTGGAMWCHVLPSMKMGQIFTVSRKLPPGGPFTSYRALQAHWNRLYGYQLPDQAEDQVVYCGVYFKLVGPRLFTYPLSCIRLSPVQRCPRVDLEGAVCAFMAHVREKLPSICGFPTRFSAKSTSISTALNLASNQISDPDKVKMTKLCNSRALPPPPPSLPPSPLCISPLFSGFRPSRPPALDFNDLFKPASSLNTFHTVFKPRSSLPPASVSSSPLEKPRFVPVFGTRRPLRPVNAPPLRDRMDKQEQLMLPTTSTSQTLLCTKSLTKVPSGRQTSATVRRIPSFGPKNGPKRVLVLDPLKGKKLTFSPKNRPKRALIQNPQEGKELTFSPKNGPKRVLVPDPHKGKKLAFSPKNGPKRVLVLDPHEGKKLTFSPKNGPKRVLVLDPQEGKKLTFSPRSGLKQAVIQDPKEGKKLTFNPKNGPKRVLVLDPHEGKKLTFSPKNGPKRALVLDPQEGKKLTFSPRNGPKRVLVLDPHEGKKLTFSPKNGPKRVLVLDPQEGKKLTFSPKNGPKRAVIQDTQEESCALKEQKAKLGVKFDSDQTERTDSTEGTVRTGDKSKREGKPRSSRDMEQMVRNNQLSRVSSSKMRHFLQARGFTAEQNLPKDLLMLRVMACLAES